MSRRKKIWLFSVVGLGLLVITASIIRLLEIIEVNKSNDFACKSNCDILAPPNLARLVTQRLAYTQIPQGKEET